MQNLPRDTSAEPTRPAGPAADLINSFWERLNMEQVARHLIATARMATGEQMIARVRSAVRRREMQRTGVIEGESGAARKVN
ncbi:MAG: hypothetical protein BIFFINMI_01345 [Phycisphaerae bacterium]|nr:hypothetical protein [Phycisphaerae bacterium]